MSIAIGALGVVLAAAIAATAAIYAARTAARISYSNKIADFRQAWINDIREDIADYAASSEMWMRKWDELNSLADRSRIGEREINEALPLSVNARKTLNKIKLRLNPRDSGDKKADDEFLAALDDLLNPGILNPLKIDASWREQSDLAVFRGRELLKREWEKTKTVIDLQH